MTRDTGECVLVTSASLLSPVTHQERPQGTTEGANHPWPTDDIASSHTSDDLYQPDISGTKWCYWVTTIFAFMNGCKRQV